MGGTGINAFTSNEIIAYHNSFPGNQIDKWMEVYSHRFVNPVFRMFQSELETVYEEKNMYADDSFGTMFEFFMKNFYKKHPSGQQSVIGSVEHLKNPSLTKMTEYYNTYYVANNMALILSGDFDIKTVEPMIEEKFGNWRTGEIPAFPEIKENPFNGREQIKVRMTPIKAAILGFRTFPKGHEDEVIFDVMSEVASNSAGTGLFDKLRDDNKIMLAALMNNNYKTI